jgi:hypothetical protein
MFSQYAIHRACGACCGMVCKEAGINPFSPITAPSKAGAVNENHFFDFFFAGQSRSALPELSRRCAGLDARALISKLETRWR